QSERRRARRARPQRRGDDVRLLDHRTPCVRRLLAAAHRHAARRGDGAHGRFPDRKPRGARQPGPAPFHGSDAPAARVRHPIRLRPACDCEPDPDGRTRRPSDHRRHGPTRLALASGRPAPRRSQPGGQLSRAVRPPDARRELRRRPRAASHQARRIAPRRDVASSDRQGGAARLTGTSNGCMVKIHEDQAMHLPFDPPLAPMLSTAADRLPDDGGWQFEPKWDGFRTLVFRDGDEILLQSRDEKPMNRYFPELLAPLARTLPERCVPDGVMAKRLDEPYRAGERTMIKVKHQRTADCVVAGFRWHKNGAGTMVGSLLLGLYDDEGTLHHVGVTAAFTNAMRKQLVAELAPLRKNALQGHPWREWADAQDEASAAGQRMPGATSRWNRGKDLSWEPLRPDRVCEVAYDHMQGSRFRHAAQFVRWRPDKRPQDCRYDQLEVTPPYELERVFGARSPGRPGSEPRQGS